MSGVRNGVQIAVIRKFIILYWIGLLLCMVWWWVFFCWRDDIVAKIELLFGVGDVSRVLTGLVWFLPTTLLFLGVLAEKKYVLRKRREVFEKCVNCGYDLRASKERCPECGDEFESSGV